MTEQLAPIPLTLITGFLGAGKTTLLNRILHENHGLRIAVMVNDFGPINIDTQLLVNVEGETISLANGCICCTIRGELLQSTLDLLSRPNPPERIIVEASGVSDPSAVVGSFSQPVIRPYLRVDSIVAVVDAEHAQQAIDPELAEAQIAVADIVVLNKIDLVSDQRRAKVREWIRGIVPAARILEAVYGRVPLELLLDVVMPEPTAVDGYLDHAPRDHGASFGTWSYVTDRPLSYTKIQQVLKTLPSTIFRAKGVLALADAPDRRFTVQVVGRRMTLAIDDPWGEESPRTELVFIGRSGSIDAEELQARFDACIAGYVAPG